MLYGPPNVGRATGVLVNFVPGLALSLTRAGRAFSLGTDFGRNADATSPTIRRFATSSHVTTLRHVVPSQPSFLIHCQTLFAYSLFSAFLEVLKPNS